MSESKRDWKAINCPNCQDSYFAVRDEISGELGIFCHICKEVYGIRVPGTDIKVTVTSSSIPKPEK